MEEQYTQGTFIPEGRRDILAAAFGRSEHPGRVRGTGFGVGIYDFFGRPSHSNSVSEKMLEQLKKQIAQEVTQTVMKQLGQDDNSKKQRADTDTPDHVVCASTKGSCVHSSSKRSLRQTSLRDGDRCGFLVDESPPRLVAIGRVYPEDSTLHCVPLPAHMIKVMVEEAVDVDAEVPVATEEVRFVRDARGGYIAWPRDLVIADFAKVNYFFDFLQYET